MRSMVSKYDMAERDVSVYAICGMSVDRGSRTTVDAWGSG